MIVSKAVYLPDGSRTTGGSGDQHHELSKDVLEARRARAVSWLVIAMVWTVLVGAAGAYVAVRISTNRLTEALVMRPPVVVVNTMDWIQRSGIGDTPAQRYASGAKRLEEVTAELEKHGALVIDASAIHGAPPVTVLEAPDASKEGGHP